MLISFLKTKIFFKKIEKKIFIYYLAGYPVSGQAGNPVSGKIIGRISGQISIRYSPTLPLLLQGRSVITIAHRLSTIKNADLIAVIDR